MKPKPYYSDDDSSEGEGGGGPGSSASWGTSRRLADAATASMPASMLTAVPSAPPPLPPPSVWRAAPSQASPKAAASSRAPHRAEDKAVRSGRGGGGEYYSDMDDDDDDDDDSGKEFEGDRRRGAQQQQQQQQQQRQPPPQRSPPPRSPVPPAAAAFAASRHSSSPVPPLEHKKRGAYSDFYDYSDMDGEDDEGGDESSNPFTVPKFAVPEQRGAPLDQKIRQDRDVLVGGRNQDYLGLAYIYKMQRPYSDHNYKAVCVLCHQRLAQDVFFPCEHRCVCRACIKSERFVEDRAMGKTEGGYNMCPLCATTIKRVLPHEHGKEVAKYWEWVEEIAPELPPGFLRNFKHSAAVLESVYVTGTFSSDTDTGCLPS